MVRLLRGIWRVLSGISRVITVLAPLVFVAIFVIAFSAGLSDSTPEPLPEKAALLIAPSGPLVEDAPPVDPVSALLSQDYDQPTLLNDLVRAIHWAAEDDRITALVLDLENLAGPSTSQTLEISDAMAEFQAAGKPVIAAGDFYTQAHYLLASQADHVLLHPEGGIFLEGFSVYRSYLKTFLEKIRVTMHVFRAGESKSAVEPYLRDDMSETERRIVTQWLGGLWSTYTQHAETGRNLPEGEMDRFIADFGGRLQASNNNLAETILAGGWVDVLADHSEMEDALAEWVGVTDEEGHAEMIGLGRYVDDVKASLSLELEGLPLIAIVPVEGTIVPGDSEEGMAGSNTITGYIDMVLEAEDLAAVVLRVNSPGGSVFASDLIRRKLAEVRAAEIPVVVSMGSVAASGGYWIAAEADEIWALPTTITGSIGAFSAFPTIEGVIDYIGVKVDGLGTTPLAGAASLNRGLSPEMSNIVQALSYGAYEDFIELVATGRNMSDADVREIAEGIVWIGADAAEIGLVDQLGTLQEAVESAAALAGVDQWRTGRTQVPPSFESILLEELSRSFSLSVLPKGGWFESLVEGFRPVVKGVSDLRDPMHVYVQCLACAPVL
ncbi:MAG: signal peptide peptidase SppA [Cellvibrionales bacterium TMED122]|nr:signal peptide peptidase SppA [Halieaceae bacterium]OUV63502.1 MAG: signal peptide peptidase SppA [Cellvibrionales bacterium TMED122]